ncbi:unnamed protein product [Paramecium primaurelia]|uniref:Cytochrome c domain-containing protein n=1 Tax=Paramecium primaurelia TaxID=5886 RepID=A0A8S1PLU7_PARPR|nr:unnamed protein product [Paramecium primaurelia]
MSYRKPKVIHPETGNGYEIRGFVEPTFKRVPHCHNDDDIDVDIPNGDLEFGKVMYGQACAGCHDLDSDLDQGPALRNAFLRRLGSNKKFSNYGWDLRARRLYWTRKLLWDFLQNPEKMFLDTNMQFDGIQDPRTLGSIIDYMQYLTVYTYDHRGSKRPIF